MIEPSEGVFNFVELDALILGAREAGIHLVLLWFGSYKNGLSTYAPGWVKMDIKRFPRVHVRDENDALRMLEMLSPFSRNAWEADARAFARFMGRVREIDEGYSTVVMVQVQNEVGLLGDSRDRSRIADRLFHGPVPEDLLRYLQNTTTHPTFARRFPDLHTAKLGATWLEVFGRDEAIHADEIFMSYHLSTYIQQVAHAGKTIHPIPMYTNTWLNMDSSSVLDMCSTPTLPAIIGGGLKAGIYPSGGPVPHALDIWKFNTPSLDFISPDIYFHDHATTCTDYRYRKQPLFIPEQRKDEYGCRRMWLAYGTYGAIGCSPFGVDSFIEDGDAEVSSLAIRRHYKLLNSVSGIMLARQATHPEDVMGFYFDPPSEKETREVDAAMHSSSGMDEKTMKYERIFGKWKVNITRAFVFGKEDAGFGLVIHDPYSSHNSSSVGSPTTTFLLVGYGFNFHVKHTASNTQTGFLHAQEKYLTDEGKMSDGRRLNGDETRHGLFVIMPNERPDYGGFPVAVTPPAGSGCVEVQVYAVFEGDGNEEDVIG